MQWNLGVEGNFSRKSGTVVVDFLLRAYTQTFRTNRKQQEIYKNRDFFILHGEFDVLWNILLFTYGHVMAVLLHSIKTKCFRGEAGGITCFSEMMDEDENAMLQSFTGIEFHRNTHLCFCGGTFPSLKI